MTADELFQYLQNVKGMSPEDAWAWVNSGKQAPIGAGIFGGTGTIGNRVGTAAGNLLGRTRNIFSNPNLSLKGMYSGLNNAYMANNGTGNPLWTRAGGIDGIGKLANIGGALWQGGKALGNISSAANADKDLNETLKDIKISAASNPLAMSYLDLSQKKLLRQAKSGTHKNDLDNIMSGVGRGLPDILKNTALGFVSGGVPGAAIQGIGTAVNKGTEGYTQGTEEANAKLQALYDQLLASEQEYRRMKRPQGLVGAGLQSRYFDQLW